MLLIGWLQRGLSHVFQPPRSKAWPRMELMTTKPLRILSLDGGGVRGISTLYILKELMRQIAREHAANNPGAPDISPRPCEYFDLICGTSTGGLIALMLGRLRMVMRHEF